MVEKFQKKNLSSSSKEWLIRQQRDFFAKSAKIQNYRSRSAYKLIQINERDKLIKPAQIIVDLGAAPGGWSQVVSGIIGDKGQVFAIDLLPITGINLVQILKGDFLSAEMQAQLEQKIILYFSRNNNRYKNQEVKLDGVLSDMSPNISGIRDSDNAKALEMWIAALIFCNKWLKKSVNNIVENKNVRQSCRGGYFVCKLFQSKEADEFTGLCKKHFQDVSIRKPQASRSESRECFLVATNFGG